MCMTSGESNKTDALIQFDIFLGNVSAFCRIIVVYVVFHLSGCWQIIDYFTFHNTFAFVVRWRKENTKFLIIKNLNVFPPVPHMQIAEAILSDLIKVSASFHHDVNGCVHTFDDSRTRNTMRCSTISPQQLILLLSASFDDDDDVLKMWIFPLFVFMLSHKAHGGGSEKFAKWKSDEGEEEEVE